MVYRALLIAFALAFAIFCLGNGLRLIMKDRFERGLMFWLAGGLVIVVVANFGITFVMEF